VAENTQSLNQFHFNAASVALISNLEIMLELESAGAAGSSAAATQRVSGTDSCNGPSHHPMQSASWHGKTKQTKEQSRKANILNKQWLQKILSPVDTSNKR